MNRSLRIYVTGKDVWALGTEDRLARACLSTFATIVDRAADADFIHTVDVEETAAKIYRRELVPTRPIIGAVNNHPTRLVEWPGFIHVAQRYMYLVPQSSLAAADMDRLGLESKGQVRIATDAESYTFIDPNDSELNHFRQQLGIPGDAYVIGLLQRDTEGRDLTVPKRQKGPDIFLAIMMQLKKRMGEKKFHVLLGGPRRHWLRAALECHDIPYTFVGNEIEGDDYPENILDKRTMCLLYNMLDLYIIPTRWEGAPRQVFDVNECGKKVISTPVGIVPDILSPECLFDTIDRGVDLILQDMETGYLQQFVEQSRKRINEFHSINKVGRLWETVYQELFQQQTGQHQQVTGWNICSRVARSAAAYWFPMTFFFMYKTRLAVLRKRFFPLKVTFIAGSRKYEPPIRYLEEELQRLQVAVTRRPHFSNIVILWGTLETLSPENIETRDKKIIFILDGDMQRRILQADQYQRKNMIVLLQNADTTVVTSDIYLSRFTIEGILLNNPVVVRFPPDPGIFYQDAAKNSEGESGSNALIVVDSGDKDYQNYLTSLKADMDLSCKILELPDDHIDRFADRTEDEALQRAALARRHDFAVLLTPRLTLEEIIELQACGLPCIYPKSREVIQRLVGISGIGFGNLDDFISAVQRMKKNLFSYKATIVPPRLDDAALTLKEIIRRPRARV